MNRYLNSFTLVELLVSMAVIAVLVGISVYGITTVQMNVRDTARRNKLNDIEIAITSAIISNSPLPGGFAGTGSPQNTSSQVYSPPSQGNINIQLPDFLNRGAPDYKNEYFTTSSSSASDYCFQRVGKIYIVGIRLESGGWALRTNTNDMSVFYNSSAPCITHWM